MKNILFIHQSADLYGSDKTLLLLLKHLDRNEFNPTVIIPLDGPLKAELEKENIKVIIAPVLKLYRKMFTPGNLLKFIKEIRSGIAMIDELNKEFKYDLVYSNTLAVLLGFIYTRQRAIKHLWHVHEIIESPKIFTRLFCKFLQRKTNTHIVYNSISTKDFWSINPTIAEKSTVIWNGLELAQDKVSAEEIITIRKTFFNADDNEIVIALVGRISRWKGQQFLLQAFNELLKNHQHIKLVFIGSPPHGQDVFLESLNQDIQNYGIADKVTVVPFQKGISKFWQSIDIAVVPSIEPEPFGLVAVEAMLAKKPVIGSNHGGLKEIIVHEETGILFEPNNQSELIKAITTLIENPIIRDDMGIKGYQRAVENFSIDAYVHGFENLFQTLK